MLGVLLAWGRTFMVIRVVSSRLLIVTVDVGQTRMGQEGKGRLSASPVINDHMHGSEEKSNEDTQVRPAHSG